MIYDYKYISIEGEEIPLENYRGKVMIIVNTASKCGFSPQFEGLERIYKKYKDTGLVVIGFPCGQFQNQELETNEAVQEFCQLRYGVSFPMSQKVAVRDEEAIPLFQYLTEKKGFEGFGKGTKALAISTMLHAKYGKGYHDNQIKWNFTKFLIDREGHVIGRFEPTVTPMQMVTEIERIL